MQIDIASFLLEHIFEIVSLLITVGGGLFALVELRNSVKNNRANYINDIVHRITENSDIQYFLNFVEYGNEWYTDKFHHGTEEERVIAVKADRTLFNYNYVCYLIDEKIINKKETELIAYYMYVLAADDEIGSYFLDLYQYTMLDNERFPFRYYLDFCIKEGCLPKAICDRRYFPEIMKYESDTNCGKKTTCPQELLDVREKYGRRLFIEYVSRCRFCKHFPGGTDKDYTESEKKCRKNEVCSIHFWMTHSKPCPYFRFMEDRWNESMEKSDKDKK